MDYHCYSYTLVNTPAERLKKPHEYIYIHVCTRCYSVYAHTYNIYTDIYTLRSSVMGSTRLKCTRFYFGFPPPRCTATVAFSSIPFCAVSHCVFIIITIVIGVLWRLITCWIIITKIHTHTQQMQYKYNIIMMVYNVIGREHERYGVIFSFFYFCDKWSAPTWVFVHTVFRNSSKSPMFLYTIHFITALSTSYKKKNIYNL
jgi:hypothetical protein